MNWFKTNKSMVQHGYSLDVLGNMMPWERHVYIDMIAHDVQEHNERVRDQQNLNRRR